MTSTKRWRRPRSALHICSRTKTENVPERKRVRPSLALRRVAALIARIEGGFEAFVENLRLHQSLAPAAICGLAALVSVYLSLSFLVT